MEDTQNFKNKRIFWQIGRQGFQKSELNHRSVKCFLFCFLLGPTENKYQDEISNLGVLTPQLTSTDMNKLVGGGGMFVGY